VNAKEEITQRPKISGQRPTNWSLVNTVDSAESILYIKRPNKKLFIFTSYEFIKIKNRKEKNSLL
jgi:hypothetical protein